MNKDKAKASLKIVHSSETPEDIAAAYANWSATYDAETAALGYLLPFQITAWVARYVGRDEGPLLDVGCGTGLSGPSMTALGYKDLSGFDISEEMLEIAAGRGVYGELKQAALGGNLPWPGAYFRAVFSAGVFTVGHAPASGLFELARITRDRGHMIFTIRDQAYEAGGYPAVLAELEQNHGCRKLEESPWFRCYAVGDPEARVKAFVYEVIHT